MGDHFAPEGKSHGRPGEAEKHLGDLGNITVGPGGTGRSDIVAPRATLAPGDVRSLAGRAPIVHEKEDIGVDPSGQSGAPIACGTIDVVAATP